MYLLAADSQWPRSHNPRPHAKELAWSGASTLLITYDDTACGYLYVSALSSSSHPGAPRSGTGSDSSQQCTLTGEGMHRRENTRVSESSQVWLV